MSIVLGRRINNKINIDAVLFKVVVVVVVVVVVGSSTLPYSCFGEMVAAIHTTLISDKRIWKIQSDDTDPQYRVHFTIGLISAANNDKLEILNFKTVMYKLYKCFTVTRQRYKRILTKSIT
ncbi:hypothetical protein GQX74_012420 [Glossina fuscipes]|nr:hypothetical protein GQX74_012420 [Glossina fuscipes]